MQSLAITGARLAWCPVRTCDRGRPFEAIYRNQRGPQSQSERSSDAIREVLRRNQRPSFEFLVRLHAARTSSTDRAACLPAARTSRCLASFSMSFVTCDEGGIRGHSKTSDAIRGHQRGSQWASSPPFGCALPLSSTRGADRQPHSDISVVTREAIRAHQRIRHTCCQ
jgi:hypothetical protein